MSLKDLRGLGPKSEEMLNKVGIFDQTQLKECGAVSAYLKVQRSTQERVSLNLLYALHGALEDKHWCDISSAEKIRLFSILENQQLLDREFGEEEC